MRFTTNSTPQTLWQRLLAQPHRLFFGSAILWGITLMIFSMVSFLGLRIDFSHIHGYGILYGLFMNAFLGFLSTVIPRYTQSLEIPKQSYFTYWILYQLGLLLYVSGFYMVGQLFNGAGLLYTSFVYFRTIRNGRFPGETDTLWLTVLIFISGVLLVVSIFFEVDLLWMSIWMGILPITFTVAQRMIPFFYAGYFRGVYDKSAWIVPFFVPLSWSIALSGSTSSLTVVLSAILAVGVIYFLSTLDIYRKSPPILWILRIGLLWLPVGLLSVSMEAFLDIGTLKMGIHILLIGFVFTLLIGFGTRVLLGHSGQPIATDRITLIFFGLVQAVIIVRFAASALFIANIDIFISLIHIGFVLFIVLMLVWGIRYRKAIF